MKLKAGELIVASITDKYPPPPANDEHASLKRWRSFSPFWWSVMQGLLEGLTQRILWQEWSDELHDEIVKHFLSETPECPEPEKQKYLSGGGDGSPVGQLGYTLEELEELFMIVNMRPQFAYVDGVVHYWDAGCCEYLPLPTISGETPAQTTPAALAAIAGGMVSLNEWANLGSPETGSVYPPMPSNNPFYTTDDSLQCAKATALAETMISFLNASADGVAESALSTVAIATLIDTFVEFFATSYQGASTAVALIWSIAVGTTASDWVNQFEVAAEDLNWPDLICELVPLMSPVITVGGFKGATIGESDYKALLDVMNEHIAMGMKVVQVVNAMPMSFFLDKARSIMPDTDCGCTQFLPYNAPLPVPAGAMNYNFAEFGYASASVLFPVAGSPYPAIYEGGRRGEIFGSQWATELVDVGGGFEGGFMQAVFLFSSPVTINQISALFTYPDGTPSNDVQFGMAHFSTDNGGEWEDGIGWGTINDFPEIWTAAAEITGFAIAARGANFGTFRRVVLAQLLVSGTFNGEPFVNLPPGQVFQT